MGLVTLAYLSYYLIRYGKNPQHHLRKIVVGYIGGIAAIIIGFVGDKEDLAAVLLIPVVLALWHLIAMIFIGFEIPKKLFR